MTVTSARSYSRICGQISAEAGDEELRRPLPQRVLQSRSWAGLA